MKVELSRREIKLNINTLERSIELSKEYLTSEENDNVRRVTVNESILLERYKRLLKEREKTEKFMTDIYKFVDKYFFSELTYPELETEIEHITNILNELCEGEYKIIKC